MECKHAKMSMHIPLRLIERVCVWYSLWMGMMPTDIVPAIQRCFGTHAYSRSIFGWCKAFQDGRTKLSDIWHPGAPQHVHTWHHFRQVKVLLDQNHSISINRLSQSVGISVGSTHRLLHKDLTLKKCCAKLVPHNLTDRHKMLRRRFC